MGRPFEIKWSLLQAMIISAESSPKKPHPEESIRGQ
jgi:hypothetical protein